MLYYIAWLILQPWKLFLDFEGVENLLQKKGPMVVVSSHRAWNDPWRIGIFFEFKRAIHSFAKKEFYCPFMAFSEFNISKKLSRFTRVVIRMSIPICVPAVVWNSKTIMVDKRNEKNPINLKALKKAYKLLGEKKIVGIFPRGTIFPTDYVNQSFVRLAIRTIKNNGKKVGVVISPVNLFGEKITFGPQFCLVPSLCKKTEYQEVARKIMEWIEDDFSYPLDFQEKTISTGQPAEEDM